MTRVTNLRTGAAAIYDLAPRAAVLSAYAQLTRKDYAWWNVPDYEGRYGHLVEEGRHALACGDWCVLASPR